MRSWATFAIAFLGFFAAAGCNDYGSTFQNNTGALITSLSPSNTNAGSGSFALTVNGSGFVAQTKVTWNGAKLSTTVTTDANGNVLTVSATVPTSLVASPGTATVITQNPFSGSGNNGLSNALIFTINPPANPVPMLTSISPNASPANGPALTLMLAGTNFIPTSDPSGGSQVLFNLPSQQVTLANPTINSSTITVTIPANLLQNNTTSAIGASVTVFNPPSPPPPNCTGACTGTGGGPSKPQTFTINAPAAAAASAAAAVEETPAVSSDGRYVAYTLMQDGHTQTFLRDTCQSASSGCNPRTILVSAAQDGSAGNDDSHWPSMSSDGRYVAFSSSATNLVVGTPSGRQVYLRDTCLGAAASCAASTQLISTDASGALVGTEAILPSVSSSGRFIAFIAVTPSHDSSQTARTKSLPAPASPNSGYRQVFVRDTCLGTSNCTPKTTRISLEPGDAPSVGTLPAGPALSGGAKNVALAGSGSPTLFTRSVPVDDRVFLAITSDQP